VAGNVSGASEDEHATTTSAPPVVDGGNPVISIPASSPWSLLLLAVMGLAGAEVALRTAHRRQPERAPTRARPRTDRPGSR
jgi:hypothetical protein